MAVYKSDLEDQFFTLFDVLKVEETSHGMGRDEITQILEEYNKFTANEVYPTRVASDSQGVKLTDKGVKVPECFKKVKESYYANGWFALGLPEEFGGMPAPNVLHMATSSLSTGANVSFQMYPGLTRAAVNVLLAVGTDKQKEVYLPPLMEGKWGGTMCLTESGAGSDVGACATTATPIDGGKYAIKGVKIFISSGESDLYENNIHLVLARTPNAPEGTKGLSLFIVPRFQVKEGGASGASNNVICTKIEEKMGIHGSATCELTFGQNGQCVGELIGKEFDGMANMFLMMNEARLMCGIQGESQGNLTYMLALQYAKERSQFGKEIINHPDVKRMLLRMRSIGRGMRGLLMYTAQLFDKVEGGQKELEDEIALLTPICKSWCTDEGFNMAVESVQIHGGYGFCTEYGVEQFVRDTKIASIYEGTNGIQAIDFVMRKILRDNGKAFASLGGRIGKSLQTPSAKKWKNESAYLGAQLQKAQEILEMFGRFAKEKKFDAILSRATEFQLFCGNIVVAWRLLESAIVADEQLTNGSQANKDFLKSKIEDFRIFTHSKLSQNDGLAHSMLQSDFCVSDLDVH